MMSNWKKKKRQKQNKTKTKRFVFLSDFGSQLGDAFAIAVYKERLVKMHVEGCYNIITSLSFVSTFAAAAASSWVLPMFKSHHGWFYVL
jgi:hypothetical protein